MIRFRPLLWPTLIAGAGIAVCIALGFWQLARLEWKTALIAEIEARASAPAVRVEALRGLPPAALAWRRATAEGLFAHGRELHLFAIGPEGQAGYEIVTPLALADGGVVFVNRGFVPQDRKAPETRAAGQVAGRVVVNGTLRPESPGSAFTPADDPAANRWFRRDVAAFAGHLGIPDPFPLVLYADEAPNPGRLPAGGAQRPEIVNNHLSYAIQWFAFAFILAVVYLAYHVRAGRLTRRR